MLRTAIFLRQRFAQGANLDSIVEIWYP